MQVTLRVLSGKSEGKDIKIKKSRFLIGRHEDCHLRPKTDSVSRRHCQIVIDGERAVCSDLGSKNGTFINDKPVEGEVELKSGDLLRVGKMRFELLIDSEVDASSKSDASSRIVLDGDITDWLEEADVHASEHRISGPETRQFRLSDLETINAAKAQPDDETKSSDKAVTDKAVTDKAGGDKAGGEADAAELDDKQKKLARKTPPTSDNSRDAAADILKRYFNRT